MKLQALALFLSLLQQGKHSPTTITNNLYIASATSTGDLVGTQAFIWVPIILVLVLVATLCMMSGLDVDKNKDTILYAKFISNVKEK